jgi:PAS domain S-box-containing protein
MGIQITMNTTAAAVLEIFGLFEGTAVGISVVDLNSRILRVNERYAEITGYSREELLSLTFASFTHPDDLFDNLACARRINKGEIGGAVFEKRYIRKNGEIRWVRNSISAIHHEGRPSGALVLSEDISARKVAEDELVRTRDVLRQLSRSIGNMPVPDPVRDPDGKGRLAKALIGALERLRDVADRTLEAVTSSGYPDDARAQASPPDGFRSALAQELARFTRCTGMFVTADVQAGLEGLSPQTSESIQRVVNMLLRDAYRFSGADSADVAIARDPGGLKVEVRDTGRGSRPLIVSKNQSHALDRRIAELGGTLELQTAVDGTLRRAVLPI